MKRAPTPSTRGSWVAVTAALLAAACEQGARPSRLTVQDRGALRARVSACLGLDLSAAADFTAPAGGLSTEVLDCLEASTDCGGVLSCAGLAGPPCEQDQCDGAVAAHCVRLDNGLTAEVREDCAQRSDGNHRCTLVDDSGKGLFATCNAGVCDGDRCEGARMLSCFGGVEIERDCGVEGRSCAAQADQVFCALPEACARDHCEGSTAVLCRGGRVDLRRDCAETVPGGRCRDQAGGVDCVAQSWAAECPADEPYSSHCAGALGVVCRSGARLTVDCPAFLDGRCALDGSTNQARCLAASSP